MRLELSLNVMLEGSPGDLPNAVNAEKTREREHQIPEERPQRTPFETPIEGSPETHIKAKSESNIREAPRRMQRTREASREDVIASIHQFFAVVHRKNRDTAAEKPTVTSSDRNENDVAIPSNIPITPDIPEAEATETETRSPRTFLPSGSPSRPTATATRQPRTWVQCISEGQINEPTQEDTHSSESSATETSVIAERVPEELGQEWRILHPFEIPGVRFLTDATPPNQRRLAENDALVELIQTTKYLKGTPTWGQRDYQLYPPQYGDPFYRGRGRGRGRGRREWLSERPTKRSNGGLGSRFSHGNRREIRGEISQMHNLRNQQNRQEDKWSVPASIERREDNTLRRELQRVPPTSPQSEDTLFTDLSSQDSPQTRTSRNVSIRDIEQDGNQPNNQTIQPGLEPAQIEVMGNALCDNMTYSSTHQQLDQVDVRLIAVGINTSE